MLNTKLSPTKPNETAISMQDESNKEETLITEDTIESTEIHMPLETSETYVTDIEELTEGEQTVSNASLPCSLQDYFGSDLILQDHLVEYRNIPLRTPTKKTILIENLTPIGGNLSVEATNFYAVGDNDDDEQDRKIDDILARLKIKKRSKYHHWEESINSNFGIVVKPVPDKGLITAFGKLSLDVWVYANTWGVYVEELVIEINDIAPFCVSFLIQVVGISIDYPITINAPKSEPIVRFGSVPYGSQPWERKLKLTNFSCIPICLAWHVFIVQEVINKKRQKRNPFNVIIDINSDDMLSIGSSNDPIQISITNHYYGKEDFNIFKIYPQELVINPKSTENVAITLNTNHFQPNFEKTNIQANLIGFVYLADEFVFQSNFFSRQTGMSLSPTRAKLLATLEMPLLKLELIKGEKRIKVYANDVIAAQEMKCERTFVFRNVDNSPITVYMHVMSPFRVVSVRTLQTKNIRKANAAIVLPGECVEVVIECSIDSEEVLKYSDMLFNEKTTVFPEIPDFKQNSVTVLRYLNIHQQGLKKQITSLELIIFYPQVQVSHKNIDFGTVFIGNTKKMLITLTNLTGSHVPFSVHTPIATNVISSVPSEGVIPKACGTTPSKLILKFYFIPMECKAYQKTIQIHTNIPFYYFQVELTGQGTNDEKFYIQGI